MWNQYHSGTYTIRYLFQRRCTDNQIIIVDFNGFVTWIFSALLNICLFKHSSSEAALSWMVVLSPLFCTASYTGPGMMTWMVWNIGCLWCRIDRSTCWSAVQRYQCSLTWTPHMCTTMYNTKTSLVSLTTGKCVCVWRRGCACVCVWEREREREREERESVCVCSVYNFL